MSDLPPIVVDVTPEPDVVVEVTPPPAVTVEVGALYAPPGPFVSYRPEAAVATEPFDNIYAITVGTTGKTYITPDFAPSENYALGYLIPADTVGSFRSIIMPQTGAGQPATAEYFISVAGSGVPLTLTTDGNPLPKNLTAGVELYFTNDGEGEGWQVVSSRYYADSSNFEFATAVADLSSHMHVGVAHDGGGVTDYIDQTRTGDDPGYYMAADNAEPMLPTGGAFPSPNPAMIALRNQAAGAGEGKTGFYYACRMPVGLTFTITSPLGDITVTPRQLRFTAACCGRCVFGQRVDR